VVVLLTLLSTRCPTCDVYLYGAFVVARSCKSLSNSS
jgi:hypothetical protein